MENRTRNLPAFKIVPIVLGIFGKIVHTLSDQRITIMELEAGWHAAKQGAVCN
jgi:hypothetical protein